MGFAPAMEVEHLNFPGSDHIPVLLRLRGSLRSRVSKHGGRGRPWCFSAHWIRKEECEGVIREGWESATDPDCFHRLFEGIEACQLGLRQWSSAMHNNP